MPYNFELAISAMISKTVAEDMIRRTVEDQTGKRVSSIEPKFRRVSKGIGPSESTETVFDGFHVFFEEEKPFKSGPDNRGFVKAEYQ